MVKSDKSPATENQVKAQKEKKKVIVHSPRGNLHSVFFKYLISITWVEKFSSGSTRISLRSILAILNEFFCEYLNTVFLVPIAGTYFLSHSLSWSNNKENSGKYHKKVWMPEDPRSAKANGRYVTEG